MEKTIGIEKHDWKKDEKNLYLPKEKPVSVVVPAMRFFVLEGKGNPNDAFFADYIEALYGASYGLKMSYKGDHAPEGFYEYVVYPLEGVWDLSEEGRTKLGESSVAELKDQFVFRLMIRQPDFVTEAWVHENLPLLAKKKKNPLIGQIRLETIEEGLCVQMLHCGSYDSEPASFAEMEAFCQTEGLVRKEKRHREIYLSDARKTAPDKLKTVLRIQVLHSTP